ncbi:unnamed protein product [Cochlearia groenlandica]
MDATMYLFREKISLGLLNFPRVGFMDCLFGMKLQVEFKRYLGNKQNHKWSNQIISYANGDLPSHGKTRKKWIEHYDRIYFPLNINGNHWISCCVNFPLKIVEVFDCAGLHHKRDVEPFATAIPRILGTLLGKVDGGKVSLSPYTIVHTPVPLGLNKSQGDCGVYALKYMECHMLDLPLKMLEDENIKCARHKIVFDLLEAAFDPVFIEQMAMFEPPPRDSEIVEIN